MASRPDITFVDTNVLVYAHDNDEPQKQDVAQHVIEDLWRDHNGAVSTQVLQEFYSVVTRKFARRMKPAQARKRIQALARWRLVTITPALIVGASVLEEAHHLSFWDALILYAARQSGASILLTEDLQDGRTIAGVTIRNPFGRDP